MIGRVRGCKAEARTASHSDVDIFFKLHVVTWSNPFYSLFDQMRGYTIGNSESNQGHGNN